MARRTWAEYNQRKLEILRLFASEGPLSPEDVTVWLGLYPTRATYSRLLKLHRMGLLHRARREGRLVYSLSPSGAARIRWLEAQGTRVPGPTPAPQAQPAA
jgi:hypothetical protein